MPNRIIKESICTSDTVDALTWFEEVLFYRLIVNCDDYGRYDARPAIIRGKLFPLKDVTVKQVNEAIIKLSTVGIAKLYEVDGRPYLQLCTWADHQSIRAKKSKFPAPDVVNASEINCMQMHADDSKCARNPIRIQSESESNPKESVSRATRFTPPTVEEVAAYCLERKNHVDPQRFVDFYAAKGWMVGKNRMKDWKAAVRTWEQREGQEAKPAPAKGQPSYSPPSNDLIAKFMEG